MKELDPVKGWPRTEASLVFKDRVAEYDGTMTARLRQPALSSSAQTTASEFGGINVHVHPAARGDLNPCDLGRTPEDHRAARPRPSPAGSSRSGTGGDGGGSIRIPAGYTGLSA